MLAVVYKTWIIAIFALFFFSVPAFSTCGHGYVGVQIGPSYAKLGDSDPRISYQSGVTITDVYPLNSNRSLSVTLNVNGGFEFTGCNWKPAIALGLGVYFNPQDYHYSGQVIETAAGNPSSTLYNYNYNINSTRLMTEIQFTWIVPYVQPFINVGIGPAWNKADSYTEMAVSSTGYSPLPPFQSQTKAAFAYQAGAGVSFAFNFLDRSSFPKERISLGYHYVYSGRTSFDKRSSAYPYQLRTGTLTSDDVYFGYTHLF